MLPGSNRLVLVRYMAPVLGLLCLMPLFVTMAGCAKGTTQAAVSRRDITAYVRANGDVFAPASARADIRSPYTASIERVYVTEGKSVKRGETLLLLAAPATAAYYDQARTAVLQAKDALAQAKKRHGVQLSAAQQQLVTAQQAENRARSSSQNLTIPPSGVIPSVPDVSAATADRQLAEQAVTDAQARMSEALVPYQQAVAAAEQQFAAAQSGAKAAQIRSPIDGTVLALHVDIGSAPDPEDKTPLITVVNLEALKVECGIPEDQLSLLEPKDPATITLKEVPNVEFSGALDQIYSEKAGFLAGQKYVALINFRNSEGMAKPGMDASVAIQVGHVNDVLAVPSGAVFKTDDQYAVKMPNGKEPIQRVVEIGLSDGQYTEIKSGLKEGDIVLVNP